MNVPSSKRHTGRYYDFKNGVDKEKADDRTLVDRTLAPSAVLSGAWGCLVLSSAASAYLAFTIGRVIVVVAGVRVAHRRSCACVSVCVRSCVFACACVLV